MQSVLAGQDPLVTSKQINKQESLELRDKIAVFLFFFFFHGRLLICLFTDKLQTLSFLARIEGLSASAY